MSWFAAHIVMIVRLQDGKQVHFPAWENLVLIEAASEAAAFQQAEDLGRRSEGDDGGTFRWGGLPAKWEFAGVRKLTECGLLGDRPGTGDEISFTELEFKTKSSLTRFLEGKPTMALVNDKFREAEPAKASVRTKGGDAAKRSKELVKNRVKKSIA